MQFTLAISCDNAAFEDRPAAEIARLLRDAARRVENGDGAHEYAKLRDHNGNVVGGFGVVAD